MTDGRTDGQMDGFSAFYIDTLPKHAPIAFSGIIFTIYTTNSMLKVLMQVNHKIASKSKEHETCFACNLYTALMILGIELCE